MTHRSSRISKVLMLFALCHISKQQSFLESILNFVEGGTQQSSEPSDTQTLNKEYDFIIVGAGTAGCVLANRLTENPNWKVLLLEAGPAENYIMDVPIVASYLQFTDANWKYVTEPSGTYCLAMNNQRCNWPRGKVIGGTSVLNYMVYTRGNRRDFDLWAKMGNTGWSYEEILPYYKKVENFTIPGFTDPKYHSNKGYLSVGYAPYHTKLAHAVINASMEYGLNYVDYDGATQTGVSFLHVTMKDGIRASSSRSYLHPTKGRKNLHLRKNAMVKKIIIDPVTKQAQGVEFNQNGVIYTVRASKEVILSAGAINSPQLLMLSGVGPQKHLTQIGIPVIKNLKVGFNLMDHVAAGGLTFMIDKPYSLRTADFLDPVSIIEFLSHHKGPLTLPGGCEVLSYIDLKTPYDRDGYPNIELLYHAGSITSDPSLKKSFGIKEEIYNHMYKPIEEFHSFMVSPMLMRPKSKGRIVLQDGNYLTKPRLFANYYANKADMQTMVEGIRLAINISRQPALKAIGAKLHDIPIKGCEGFQFGSDAYWECHARHFTFTIYHQSGTCKMGPRSDKMAVVDPRLKVHGLKGLRVIDASIMPEIPAAHINAPIFMIAEKGADMIKEDYGCK